MLQTAAERLALRRDTIGGDRYLPQKTRSSLRPAGSLRHPSANAFETSCMRSNLQTNIFWLKVRTRCRLPESLAAIYRKFVHMGKLACRARLVTRTIEYLRY